MSATTKPIGALKSTASEVPPPTVATEVIDRADLPVSEIIIPPQTVTTQTNGADKPKSTASEVSSPTVATQTIDRAQPTVPPPTVTTQTIHGTTIKPTSAVDAANVAILATASPSDISTEVITAFATAATKPSIKNSSSSSASASSASIDTAPPKQYSLAERMLSKVNSDVIDLQNNIYGLKLRQGKKFPAIPKIARCYIGREPVNKVTEKVLMIVGATGAGKSTLINGIVNYLFGVQWNDKFRFKMIVEQPSFLANSVTNAITAYTIYWQEGSPCDYTLTIIDTPGFGDTSGLKRDKEITKQIKDFFSIPSKNGGIDHLDGIGFVTQASQSRLTHTQRYVFDAILAIFGHDIANNIFMMITFADGKKPPVVDAIKASNIPYSKYFKFNNSALFPTTADKEEDDEGDFDELFWAMGMKSLKNFFNNFETAQPRSLQLTREVLEERQRLETNVNGLQPQINQGLAKMEEMRKERKIIEDHEADIKTNKEFKYKIKLIKQRKVNTDAKHYVTNCLTCNRTCHKLCVYSNNEDKYQCSAMDGGGYSGASCTVCPGKCGWRKHVNNPYYFELYEEEEERTSQELKMKFDAARQGKSMAEQMLRQSEHRLDQLDQLVMNMIRQAQQSLNRLGVIALKPNPLSEVEYIELMIESEKAEFKPGWKERVRYLEEAKKEAKITKEIAKAEITPSKRVARLWEKISSWCIWN